MSLNSRIKERREQLQLSRIDLADQVGVTASAIANYENAFSYPRIEILYRMFAALKCDANYLYQDEIKTLVCTDSITFEEMEHIKNYRSLDDAGRQHVDTILSWERERMQQSSGNNEAQK